MGDEVVPTTNPNWAEQVAAIAAVVSACGLLGALGAAFFVAQQAREERKSRQAQMAADFSRRWNGEDLVQTRRLIRQFQTKQELSAAFQQYSPATPSKRSCSIASSISSRNWQSSKPKVSSTSTRSDDCSDLSSSTVGNCGSPPYTRCTARAATPVSRPWSPRCASRSRRLFRPSVHGPIEVRLKARASERSAGLRQAPLVSFTSNVYRRFQEMEGKHLAVLISANLFMAVIPLFIVGYALIEAFNPNRTFAVVLIQRFHITGETAAVIRNTFTNARGGKNVALSISAVSVSSLRLTSPQ
jgi:hypothetical protein